MLCRISYISSLKILPRDLIRRVANGKLRYVLAVLCRVDEIFLFCIYVVVQTGSHPCAHTPRRAVLSKAFHCNPNQISE